MHNYNHNQTKARPPRKFSGKPSRGPRKFNNPRPEFADRTARQQWRHGDLLDQFQQIWAQLRGWTARIILAGDDCRHDPFGLRPVHRDQQYPNRPPLVHLSVTADALALTSSMSIADGAKLRYVNGSGNEQACWDFLQTPRKGGNGKVLDGFVNHAGFTCGNNLLQGLVNRVGEEPEQFSLPRLLIRTSRVVLDPSKVEAAVAMMHPEMQERYRKEIPDAASVLIGGVLFGDAAFMPDAEIAKAFAEKRAYEDYSHLLGSRESNPAKKVLNPANPAREVIQQLQLPHDWSQTLTEELANKLIGEMRRRLPLPEMATDSDLLNALERPMERLHFSIPIEKVPTQAVVRAMRRTYPPNAAIGRAVTDVELIEAAKSPFDDLVVGVYSKLQIFRTEDMQLPNYAIGSFWPVPESGPAVPLVGGVS